MAAVEGAVKAGATIQDLYSQYGKQIYAYCLHRLRSREEAEDAVQTTFMNAFRSLQRGATTQFEQAWLFKIAQNVCFARQTSSSRRLRLEAPNDFEVLQEIVPAREGEQPLELIGLEDALEQMPENQRRAILLREWQGLSYREIGEQLGLTQAAVEMLIFRARRALAGALEQPEAPAKKVRAGRRLGALGSLLGGALKTLFGGGAAIKAVSLAAAAIAVVGESASHTIVHHSAAKAAPVAQFAAQASASPASRARTVVRGTSGALVSPRQAVVVQHPVAAHAHGTAGNASTVAATHAHRTTRAHTDDSPTPTAATPPVVAAPPTVAAPAPAPAAAPAPAPAASPKRGDDRQPTSVSPSAPPVTVTPPAPDDHGSGKQPPVVVTPPAPVGQPPAETAPPPPPPPVAAGPSQDGPGTNGNGNAYGHDKQKDAQPAPPASAPPVTTTATVPAATAPAPPSPGDEGHGNGNGNGNGRGHNK